MNGPGDFIYLSAILSGAQTHRALRLSESMKVHRTEDYQIVRPFTLKRKTMATTHQVIDMAKD
jgi:hypothetical protein